MKTVAEALAAIPGRRDALSRIDDQLSDVIRYVERVLGELKVGTPAEISYETPDGRFYLNYEKLNGRWAIVHSTEEDDYVPVTLVSSPRHVRAEVFHGQAGLAPIEMLIVEVAESLSTIAGERSPVLEVALRLANVLEAAGFPDAK